MISSAIIPQPLARLPWRLIWLVALICTIGIITLFSAAYVAENVRGGLQAIPTGQIEAAQALGLPGPMAILAVIAVIIICIAWILMGKRCIPAVCFTDSDIVRAGLSSAEARAKAMKPAPTSFPFSANGRAMTTISKEGFTRIVAGSDTYS